MRRFIIIFFLVYIVRAAFGQTEKLDSIPKTADKTVDSFRLVDDYNRTAILMYEQHVDGTFYYAVLARDIATRLHYKKGIADAINNIGVFYDVYGDAELAIRYYKNANAAYEEIKDTSNVVQTWMNIAGLYFYMGKADKAEECYVPVFELGKKIKNDSIMALAYCNYVLFRGQTLNYDSARQIIAHAQDIALKYKDDRTLLEIQRWVALDLIAQGKRSDGELVMRQILDTAIKKEYFFMSLDVILKLGDLEADSNTAKAKQYYKRGLNLTAEKNYYSYEKSFLEKLYAVYEKEKNNDSTLYYGKRLIQTYKAQEQREVNSRIDYIKYANQEQQVELLTERTATNKKILILVLIVCLLLILVAGILWISRRAAVRTRNLLTFQLRQLEATSHSLEINNENYARVLKVVAHDLRNPLSSIGLLSSMIVKDNEVAGQSLEFAKLINQISSSSNAQIDELMNTDLGIGEEIIEKQNIRVDEVLGNTVTLLSFKAREKRQELVFKSAGNIFISADPDKLTRVFSNLITNAIKFSVEDSKIQIRLKTDDNKVKILIKDAGIGIPKLMQPNIFDPFTQSRRKGTAGEETFGLGLFISKKIVEAHQGQIWFESEEGSGTTFFVNLPYHKSEMTGY
jgi:signal transduction histidine kinase